MLRYGTFVVFKRGVGRDAARDICILFLKKVLRPSYNSSMEIFKMIIADFYLSALKLLFQAEYNRVQWN